MAKREGDRYMYMAVRDCVVNTAANGQLACTAGPSITKCTVVETPGPMPAELCEVTPSRKNGVSYSRPKFVRLTEGQMASPQIGGRALLRQVVV